jgi:hypothetical protein
MESSMGAHIGMPIKSAMMYDDVRASSSPRDHLLKFLQHTYEAGATLGHWDRDALEGPNQLLKAA